ncbi:MAG: pyrroloquinoline quinone-dependent dehydrogenase [Rhizomicrobium sp.]
MTDGAAKSFLKTLALFAAIAGFIAGPAIAGDGRVDWPAYNGSTANTHYSSLTQINTGNVSKLKEVWRFDTGEMGGLETSPLIIDGVLYAYTPKQKVIALDAASGASLWTFDPQTEFPAEKIGSRAERGLSYWRRGGDRRILAGASHYIYAIDAASGKIIRAFGNNGRIDLRENLRGDPKTLSVTITSPGVITRDLFIVGCGTPESLPAPPGDIRAYDVRTGKLRWTFHTIPHPGEFGYDTWPKDAWLHSGAANNWTGMALDQARGIVYVPTGSAATDWYGADRIGDNLFANSLIALDAATGKRIWHFQGVRHDLWDRDFPAPPSLVTVRRGGKDIPAIVQTSKQGFVFLFNRVTGKPLFPIEYRKVPASDVPGEVAATTQPVPTLPAPLSRQMLTEDDMTHRTPEAHQWAVEQFRKFNYTGQFTPNKVGVDTLMFPGWNGGGEWGGVGFDPKTHVAYINATDFGLTESLFKNTGGGGARATYMRQCSACHGQDRAGAPPLIPPLVDIGKRLDASQIAGILQSGRGRMPSFPNLDAAASQKLIQYLLNNGAEAEAAPAAADAPAQYDTTGYHAFLDPQGYPATSTPWGTLNAINLDTGQYLWKIPFGQYPELVAQGLPDTGSENFGGPVITAGGVLFIGATTIDKKFRAFDMKTGKLLWETLLPYSATATPAIYAIKGRQFVVIAAGGQRDPATPPGGVYVAYALPK